MILKRCILGELSLNIVYKSSYNHQFVSASSMNWKKNELTFVWHKKNLIKNLDIDRTLDISSKSFWCSIHCCSFSSFAVCKRLFTRSLMDFDDDQDRVYQAVYTIVRFDRSSVKSSDVAILQHFSSFLFFGVFFFALIRKSS